MNQILVYELFIRKSWSRSWDVFTRICLQPILAIIRLGFVKRQINTEIRFLASVFVRHNVELLEILLCLVACRCTQSLVILHAPTARGIRLLPLFVFVLRIERLDLLCFRSLDDRRRHVRKESRDCQQSMPQLVKQINQQSANMGAVVILVGHDEDTTVPQGLHVCVFLATFQPNDLFQVCNFFCLFHFANRRVFYVQQLTLQWEYAVILALVLRQTRQSHGFSRVAFCKNKRAFMAFSGSSVEGIVQLWHTSELGLLLAIGFCILFVILDTLLGDDFIDDA